MVTCNKYCNLLKYYAYLKTTKVKALKINDYTENLM